MKSDMLSVIMPAYNESQSLKKTIEETMVTLQEHDLDYEIIVVDDGSTDNTYEIAASLVTQNPKIKPFSYKENRGRGYAIKYGFQQAKGDLVVLIDADSDLPPSQIPHLLEYMKRNDADVVNGSKRHALSQLSYPLRKRFLSWGYQFMVRTLFRIPLKDTLTGLKLFKREVLQEMFPKVRAEGFVLNFELLLYAHRLGYRIVEAPIEINYDSQVRSNITPRSILNIFRETLAIFYRMNLRHYYDKGKSTAIRVVMVSDYPPRQVKHSKAIAAYCKNLSLSLIENKVKLTVVADVLNAVKEEYQEDNIRVIRCWKQEPSYLLAILRQLWRIRSEIDIIHIQHEFFLYGGAVTASLFPFMLLLLRILGKPIVVTLHGVISLDNFSNGFARENRLKGNPSILKMGLWSVIRLISLLATRLIVHESFLADTIVQEYGVRKKKVAIIHHGIEEDAQVNSAESKNKFGLDGKKVVMFFGYLSGYKGLHILIDAFTSLEDENIVLIVAGGENPRMSRDRDYREYIKRIRIQATTLPGRVKLVGFVPEEEIPAYFAAADVVVLPYTSVMSASAPLTLCITYRRPFLLSEPFKKVIGEHSFLFKNTPETLRAKIEEFFADSRLSKEALGCAETLAQERSWEVAGRQTVGIYNEVIKKCDRS